MNERSYFAPYGALVSLLFCSALLVSCEGPALPGLLSATPIDIQFGVVAIGDSAEQMLTISNVGENPVDIDVLQFEQLGPKTNPSQGVPFRLIEAGGEPAVSLGPYLEFAVGESMDLTVRFAPILDGFTAGNDILIDSRNLFDPLRVRVAGEAPAGVYAEITVDPLSADFGVVEAGNQARLDFFISSTGTGNLSIETTRINGDARFSIVPPDISGIILPPEAERTLSVEFNPGVDGSSANGGLVIPNNDPARENLTIPLVARVTFPFGDLPDCDLQVSAGATFDGNAWHGVSGVAIELDGSASASPHDLPITLTWTIQQRPNGSSALMSAGTGPTTTFTPDLDGSYILRLTVRDSDNRARVCDMGLQLP